VHFNLRLENRSTINTIRDRNSMRQKPIPILRVEEAKGICRLTLSVSAVSSCVPV
jgi:hypothetical protein